MSEEYNWKEQFWKYNPKKDIIKFCLLFIPTCLLILVIVLSYIFQWEYPDWAGFVAGYGVFGGVFIGFTIYAIWSMTKCRRAAGKDAILLTGTIIGHYSNNAERKYKNLYYPIYEYEVDGQKQELVSNIAMKKRGRDVGQLVKIYYDPNTGNAFCVADMRRQVWMCLTFAAVGALAVGLITMALVQFYL